MKYFINTISALSFMALLIFASCGGDGGGDGPQSPGGAQADLLNGSWQIASVTFDNTPRNDTWGTDFTVSFSGASAGTDDIWGGNFNATGYSSDEPDAQTVWPSNGTWDFAGAGSSEVNTFTRNDGVTVSIVQVTESSLIVRFTIPDPSGRTDGVFDSEWNMEFTAN
ncbi:MAG: hypothetical protein AAGA85_11395 [Bacteroidota bacterium]